MIEVFWGCLVGGIIFSLISLLGGHSFHHGLHGVHGTHHLHVRGIHFLNPLTIVGAVTAFGGAGILLTKYSTLAETPLLAAAIFLALLLSVIVHFVIVKPMEHSENSMAFSVTEYVGMSGLVTVPIPATGHGQVMVNIGGGNTCEPAASFDEEPIPSGSKVVIVEVKDHTLFVSPVNIH
jgi:membrane-bound ClpP family serine protease